MAIPAGCDSLDSRRCVLEFSPREMGQILLVFSLASFCGGNS